MGMFDSVYVPCPKCNTEAEFQSKGGDCCLENYTLKDVPNNVLSDINRHSPKVCSECGESFYVKVKQEKPAIRQYDNFIERTIRQRIEVVIGKPNDDSDDDDEEDDW